MSSKIKIKIGDIELEYEGSDEFLKEELPVLLKTMFDLNGKRPQKLPPKSKENGGAGGEGDGGLVKNTTTGYAQAMNVEAGPDLVMAAAFSLTSNGKDSFTMREIRTEVKSAKAYYKESYANNIDRTIKALVKQKKLNDVGSGQYSLPQSEIDEYLGNGVKAQA